MATEGLREKSRAIALIAHEGQFRKMGEDKGKPYIIHPDRVAARFQGSDILAAIGQLHDVIEDAPVTAEDLLEQGIPGSVVDAVVALTKKLDENYLDAILRVKENALARQVKMADLEDNMQGLDEGSLKDKYRLALHILKNS